MSSVFSVDWTDLVTDRLILRPLSAEHARAVLDDVRLDHWAHDYPDAGDRVIAKMLGEAGRPGQRQVIERSTGQAVGGIGLFWPPTDGVVEFGYGIVPSRQGRGYATEAAGALIAGTVADPVIRQVYATVELTNPASVRVLERAGLRCTSRDAAQARFEFPGSAVTTIPGGQR